MISRAQRLLDKFNSTYLLLHQKFEELFWVVKMGDQALAIQMNESEKKRDEFRSNPDNLQQVRILLKETELSLTERERLKVWEDFFQLYQAPPELTSLRSKIAKLESKIDQKLATLTEGYTNPKTGKFVPASKMKMRMIVQTDPDEEVRKACWIALETMATVVLDDYIKVVTLRNQYAKTLGFEDFYAYRVHINEGMVKNQIFEIFDEIYESTKRTFEEIRELEKTQLELRKPWNFGYMMSGSFIHEENPYYNFDEALMRWGRSFAALGIDYKGGKLQLDLLDRTQKYNNGFCHYPIPINFRSGKKNAGGANFTCNVVYRQIGAGALGMHTLFHEGGHAADRLNSEQTEVCLNTEYPPASSAWAETHSQFLDTMYASIEWRMRYAKDKDGNTYPFELFENKVRKLRIIAPLNLHSIMFVSNFEREIYETKNLTAEQALTIAKKVYKKYFDLDGESVSVLSVPHIYSWDSSAYYHGYGLAILALEQWRKYFYDKYGYIVDNPNVGKELTEVWKLASSKTFADFIKLATGKPLSPQTFIENATMKAEDYLVQAKQRIQKMESVPAHIKPVRLNAQILMVHGKDIIADNSESFEKMAQKYTEWLNTQNIHS